ncbi:MAG: hypothetical protein ABSC29_03805 [Minisyncoccia bacterium]|jgi:oligoribonuclease NrnB/cAMP/cGMP phosphodiesterase (DHH superfamily)
MKYDIYFHNDFDGRASAAVMLAFLRSRGDDIAHYVPVTYGYEKPWLKEDLAKKKNPAIVVDFLYHPKAAWWFDHHRTTFREEKWKRAFKPDRFHRYDYSYRSACHLVYDSLKKDFGWKPPRHFKELVRWLDVVDSARYRSARETIEMKHPALEINAFIETLERTTNEENRFLIGLLAKYPLARVVAAPRVARAVRALHKKVARSMAFLKKNLLVFKRTTFVDVTKDPLDGLLRYAPYYLYPKSIYNIRLRPKGKGVWYLGVGASPWRRSANKLELGKLMRRRYGGGGHKAIGATEFLTRADAMKAFKKINELLNR